jgi:hypothetical protein
VSFIHAERHYAECHYAEWQYGAECHGAVNLVGDEKKVFFSKKKIVLIFRFFEMKLPP